MKLTPLRVGGGGGLELILNLEDGEKRGAHGVRKVGPPPLFTFEIRVREKKKWDPKTEL